MNKRQYDETIKKVITSPRSDLQKILMLQNAFDLYVKEKTDRIVAALEETKKSALDKVKPVVVITFKCELQEFTNMCFDEAIDIVKRGGEE